LILRLRNPFHPPYQAVFDLSRTKNLRAVQLLLGHTKLESTVRYLGIEVEDALELAEQTEV
jgi:site-specific recombinase XerC